MRNRATAISARKRPNLLHPWSHLPSVAVLLGMRLRLERASVSLKPLIVPCSISSCEARLSAMQEQFSNAGLCEVLKCKYCCKLIVGVCQLY